MNNLFFKSANRLIKNSPIELGAVIISKMDMIQTEQRAQRQDLVDIKGMLNRLLIDAHLQMQVDEYFDKDKPQEDL